MCHIFGGLGIWHICGWDGEMYPQACATLPKSLDTFAYSQNALLASPCLVHKLRWRIVWKIAWWSWRILSPWTHEEWRTTILNESARNRIIEKILCAYDLVLWLRWWYFLFKKTAGTLLEPLRPYFKCPSLHTHRTGNRMWSYHVPLEVGVLCPTEPNTETCRAPWKKSPKLRCKWQYCHISHHPLYHYLIGITIWTPWALIEREGLLKILRLDRVGSCKAALGGWIQFKRGAWRSGRLHNYQESWNFDSINQITTPQ